MIDINPLLWIANLFNFVKTLFEEKDTQYVEPENSLIFVPNNEDQFLWFSSRDNFKQLYLYNTDGKLIRKVTNGEWDITKFIDFDVILNFDVIVDFNVIVDRDVIVNPHLGPSPGRDLLATGM